LTTNFFKELYTADPTVQPNQVIDLFQPLITEEMNADLCKEFSDEEISNALFQIGPLRRQVLMVFLPIFSNGTRKF
jgi:hypothetical protein